MRICGFIALFPESGLGFRGACAEAISPTRAGRCIVDASAAPKMDDSCLPHGSRQCPRGSPKVAAEESLCSRPMSLAGSKLKASMKRLARCWSFPTEANGFFLGYDWEVSEVYVFRIADDGLRCSPFEINKNEERWSVRLQILESRACGHAPASTACRPHWSTRRRCPRSPGREACDQAA